MKIIWTRGALTQLEQIQDYVAHDSARAAYAIAEKIRVHTYFLIDNPKLGRIGRIEETRELVVPDLPYIVIYTVDVDLIKIVRVLHGAQDWPGEF